MDEAKIGQAEKMARRSLSTARGWLVGERLLLGHLFREMRSAISWGIEVWLIRRGMARAGVGWSGQEAHFIRVAPDVLREEYLRLMAGMKTLGSVLRECVQDVRVSEVDIASQGLAVWRNLVIDWLNGADRLLDLLIAPLDEGVAVVDRLRRQGSLQGRFDRLMPALVLARRGCVGLNGLADGRLPGMFSFGDCSHYTGMILPLFMCRDERLRRALWGVTERLRRMDDLLDADGVEQWFDEAGLDSLTPQVISPKEHWVAFTADRDVFTGVLQHFDYVTAVYDAVDASITVAGQAPFEWASPGELMDWCLDAGMRDVHGAFGLYLCAEVVKIAMLVDRFDCGSQLLRPVPFWEPFFQRSGSLASANIAMLLSFVEEDVVDIQLTLGDSTIVIECCQRLDPLPNIYTWLMAIEVNDVPVGVRIEGDTVDTQLACYGYDAERVLLVITRNEDQVLASGVLARCELLNVFRAAIATYFSDEERLQQWSSRRFVEGYRELWLPLYDGMA